MLDVGLGAAREGNQPESSGPVLTFEPARQLLESIPHEERDRYVMLLDLDAHSPRPGFLRLLLRVVFRPIAIRRGWLTRADYYIATTGAVVKVEAANSEVISHTGPTTITVDYDAKIEKEKSNQQKFEPELKGKFSAMDLEIKPGALQRERKITLSSGVKFSSEEMLVAPTNLGDAIEWRIDGHRAEKAVRDFPVEDVALEVTLRWKTASRRGKVQARPSEVSFFDSSKRRLSRMQSIMMVWVLKQKGITVQHLDGFKVAFTEGQNGHV